MFAFLVITLSVIFDLACIIFGIWLGFVMEFNITGLALMGIVFGLAMLIPCTEFILWGLERLGFVEKEDDGNIG